MRCFPASLQKHGLKILIAVAAILTLPTISLASPGSDTQPPNVVSFSFTPQSVNASASDQTILFTVRLTDDLSGVTDGMINGQGVSPSQARFHSPSGSQIADVLFAAPPISGTVWDGVYSKAMTVPRYSESGTWQLQYLMLVDDVGNTRSLDRSQMIGLGFPTDFTVTSIGDTQPPNVTSFDFLPKTVDVWLSARTITFTTHLTDNLSGVTDGVIGGISRSPSQARFHSPSGSQIADVLFAPPVDLVSGTPLNGAYQSTMTVPRYSESGTWQLQYLMLVDDVGNTRRLDRNQMIALGFHTDFLVSSAGDTQLPNVISFDFSPKTVDVSLSTRTITFTTHLTDDVSGITDGIIGGIGRSPSQARFRSPSTNQFIDVLFAPPVDLVSGTPLNGVYINTASIAQCNELGTWQLEYLMLVDDVGNTRTLYRAQMVALGFPTDFVVTTGTRICSLLTGSVSIGNQTLPVVSTAGFSIGDNVRVNPGGATQEDGRITGFGSLILASGVHYAHSAKEVVLNLSAVYHRYYLPQVLR